MEVLLLMFLSCALTEVSLSDDHSFSGNSGSLAAKPMNNGPKNILRLHELIYKKEIPMPSMHKYESHKLKREHNPTHAPRTLTKKVRRRRQNSDNQQTCLIPENVTVWNGNRRGPGSESENVSLNIFPKSSFKLRVMLYVCCDDRGKVNFWSTSYCSSTLRIQDENVWHSLRITATTSDMRKNWRVDVRSEGVQASGGTYFNESVFFSSFRVHFESGDVTWYFGPPPKCTRKITSTTSVPATESSADVETINESGIDWMSQHESAQKMNIILGSVLGLLVTVLVILGIVIMRMRKKGRLAQDGHVQKPRDASRPLQNCPAPRQVDQTTFSVAPTATISPLTVTRAGGDAEVEYYEPPECFPIDSTSAAYVIFDDDGNPIN